MSFFGIGGCGVSVLVCAASVLAVATGCSSANLAGDSGSGGQSAVSTGAPGTGGSVSTGVTGATGGTITTGGTIATGATGGSVSLGTGGAKATGGVANSGTGGASASTAPTWSQLYTNYFGPGTAGNCVASGCHGPGGNSPSFNSATTMCSALKAYGGGKVSFNSILSWMGRGGSMPANGAAAPANAVVDITAWQNAGAVCP